MYYSLQIILNQLTYWYNYIYNIILPFKIVNIKNKKSNWITYLLINLSYHIKNTIFNIKIEESTFIDFKNNKRNISTILKPTDINCLLEQIKKIELNSNNKYERIKLDNPPQIIIKSINFIDNNNNKNDITKMLKTFICSDFDVSIEDFIYFTNKNNTNNGKIVIAFFQNFIEQTIEYEYNQIKNNYITFFKNLCIIL